MKYILLISLFLGASMLQAQSLKHANTLFEEMNYSEAAIVYEDYLGKSDKLEVETVKKAADSYYFLNKNKEALKWYEQLYTMQGENIEDKYFFRYIQSLRGVKDYDKANELTEIYLKRKNDPQLIDHFLSHQKRMEHLENMESSYTIRNLDSNSPVSDFGPAFYGDKIVFSSSNSPSDKLYIWNNQPFLDLFVAERTGNGSLTDVRPFMPEVSSRYHDATISFSKNLDTVYYTTNIKSKNSLFKSTDRVNNFHILKGVINDNSLSNIESLPFNSTEYSVGHPALSDDGKFLFFVSDMPGGFGETDIYVVEISEDGTMGAPENLGGTINTEGREMFPFFNNNTLYFSSDGHFGLGGLDIVSSEMAGNFKFSEPKNLGSPVNSNRDDFSFILDRKKGDGYMSSNRSEGKGDDDIYHVKRNCYQLIVGKAIDSITRSPLKEVVVTVFDEFENEVQEVKTDDAGEYSVELPCNSNFKLIASKQDYTSSTKKVTTLDEHMDTIEGIDFALSAYKDLVEKQGNDEIIKVNPIYFDFNKSNITDTGAKELDKVVYVLQEFPQIKIKIESHTDARGTDVYNLKLSQARAEATKDYILSKNISKDRIISYKGYGEIDIKNECKDGVECDEVDHQENRRSDFIIVSGSSN